MFSSAPPFSPSPNSSFLHPSKPLSLSNKFKAFNRQLKLTIVDGSSTPISSLRSSAKTLHNSLPLASSLAILLWSNPVNAGILSGFSGLESIPGPQLPQLDFLTRLNEENQKKYAELNSRFKASPILKERLERTNLNKDKNRKQILDKYCLRGAEWGVGDCSTEGMTADEKEKFIAMLKQKLGAEE